MHRRHFIGGAIAATSMLTMPQLAVGQLSTARESGSLVLDLEIIRQALAIHPGALRYLSSDGLSARHAQFEAEFTGANCLENRYLALSRLLGALRCGHTSCSFYNQSDAVDRKLLRRPTRLPFLFRWLGHRMIVTADHSGTGQLHPGTQILTIDGRTVADILQALMPFARADGSNDGKRRSQLSVPGGEPYPAFDIFQSLLFPPDNGRFELVISRPDGTRTRIGVAPATFDERLAMAEPPPEGDEPRWSWTMRPDNIAVLTMPTWVVYRGNWDWRTWLEARLDTLGGAQGLIIDIRGNEGGLSCGDPILARLAKEDLVLDQYAPRVRFRRSPVEMDPYFDTPSDDFRFLGKPGVEVGEGFFGYPPDRPSDVIAAKGPHLDIRTVVLTDESNSSATFFFAERIKRFGLARLIGKQTGGNLRGINAGALFFVRLPESGIEFDLPLVGYFPTSPQPDSGISPEVSIGWNAAAIGAGLDQQMVAALRWIKGRVG